MTTPTAPVGPAEEKNINLVQEFSATAFNDSVSIFGSDLRSSLEGGSGDASFDAHTEALVAVTGTGDLGGGVDPGLHKVKG